MALLALLFGAHAGAARVTVQVLFVVFVVTATIWVRGQYADSLVDRPWLLSLRWAFGRHCCIWR